MGDAVRDPQQMEPGPQSYPPVPDCQCGHSLLMHAISEATKQRTACSSWHGGKCKCKKYVELE